MISEVALVAIVGASATVLVGFAAALAQVFGPAWRDSRMRKLERELKAEDTRYKRAQSLVEAASQHYLGSYGAKIKLENARTAFLATLRAGEGPVEAYVGRMLQVPKTGTRDDERVAQMLGGGLFAYLRGDIDLDTVADLRPPAPTA